MKRHLGRAAAIAAALVGASVAGAQQDPLSSVVAVNASGNQSIPALVRQRVDEVAKGALPPNAVFPLPNATTDTVRTLPELSHNVVIKWLDPITNANVKDAPVFGANCDFIAFFGAGWNAGWQGDIVGAAPYFRGAHDHGWIWVNHEYISNSQPTPTSAPDGQHLTYAKFLKASGILTIDPTSPTWPQAEIDTYIRQFKRQVGGSWLNVYRDENGAWRVNRNAANRRYDATSGTQVALVGQPLFPLGADHKDDGTDLPTGTIAGIQGNCSGGVSPWGTVFSAEENVQSYYGDLEASWTSGGQFLPGNGFDAGNDICPIFDSSRSGQFARGSKIQMRHNRDAYGYLVEIDPTVAANRAYTSVANQGDGLGHRKLGALGRARWENCTFVVGKDGRLLDGQPIVIYAANDRRGGRIYKFVSSNPYQKGMTRGQVRALLDSGSIYVAHFAGLDNTTGNTLVATKQVPTDAAPGQGQWIHMSTTSTDTPPNAVALNQANVTVGQALQDRNYNSLGGFPTDDYVRLALYTAANKLGIMELNRPEDLEWNAKDPSGNPRLYIAFTKHGRQVALDQNGVLYDPQQHAANSPLRPDPVGSIFVLDEANPAAPASSKTFTYFQAWLGTQGTGPYDVADPDNLMLDANGGVWFGTDGNFGVNGTADGLYYLDLDPMHKSGQPGVTTATYGLPFRVIAGPSDSEATGPALTTDERTIFFAVQHPGENFNANTSTWPQQRP